MISITFEKLENYIKENTISKKVVIFIGGDTDRYSASSYIRLLSPLNELTDKYIIQIVDNTNYKEFFKDLNSNNSFDTIIIQRDIFDKSKIEPKNIKLMYNQLKKNNVRIIFDIDDDLLNIYETHTAFERYSKLRDIIIFMINNSDIITVSTSKLKNSLKKYNNNIIIIPNTLMKLWNFNSNQEIKDLTSKQTIKIGYFGTRTHGNDLKLLEQSIINVKTKFPNKKIIFEIAGVCRENYDWIKKITIPQNYSQNPSYKDQLKNIIAYFLDKINIPHSLPYCNFIDWMKNEKNGILLLHL